MVNEEKGKGALFLFVFFAPVVIIRSWYWYAYSASNAPGTYVNFVCTALPYTKLSLIFVPQRFFDYALNHCASNPTPQAIAIATLLLMSAIMMGLAIMDGILSWLEAFVLPDAWCRQSKKNLTDLNISQVKDGTFRKKNMTVLGFSIFMWLIFIWMGRYNNMAPEDYLGPHSDVRFRKHEFAKPWGAAISIWFFMGSLCDFIQFQLGFFKTKSDA